MNISPVTCNCNDYRNLKSQTDVRVQPSFGMAMNMSKINKATKVNDGFTKKSKSILMAVLSFFGLKKLSNTEKEEQPVTIPQDNLQHKSKNGAKDPKYSAKLQRRAFLNEQRKKRAWEKKQEVEHKPIERCSGNESVSGCDDMLELLRTILFQDSSSRSV